MAGTSRTTGDTVPATERLTSALNGHAPRDGRPGQIGYSHGRLTG